MEYFSDVLCNYLITICDSVEVYIILVNVMFASHLLVEVNTNLQKTIKYTICKLLTQIYTLLHSKGVDFFETLRVHLF